MVLRHAGERGICIDHWAALVVSEGRYSVLAIPGKGGSVLPDGGSAADRTGGVPGVWRKDVDADGNLVTTLVPPEGGLLDDLLAPAAAIVPDPRLASLRGQNPAV